MFAVLKTGGKQYKVARNDVFTIEKLMAEPGETVRFDEILMLGGKTVTVGAPTVAGASVTAEVLEQLRGPKVVSFKKRRRTHSSQRKRGHRQYLTRVRITEISGTDGTMRAEAAAPAIADEAAGAEAAPAAN